MTRRIGVRAISSALVLLLAVTTVTAQETRDRDDEVREFDTLILKDGTEIVGTLLSDDGEHYEFRQGGIIAKYHKFNTVADLIPRNPPEAVYPRRERRAKTARQRYELGVWCVQYAMPDRARMHIEEAVLEDPTIDEAYEQLETLYQSTSIESATTADRDAQIGVAMRSLERPEPSTPIILRASDHFCALNDVEAAVEMLSGIVGETVDDKTDASIASRLAVLLDQLGRRDKARRILEGVQTSGRSNAELRELEAGWYLESVAAGEPGGFRELQDRVAALSRERPSDSLPDVLLASGHLLVGELESAVGAYLRAIETAGKVTPETALSLALAYARTGRNDLARTLVGRVEGEVDEEAPPAYRESLALVRAYMAENEFELSTALQEYQAVLALPSASWQARIIALQALDRFGMASDLAADLLAYVGRFSRTSNAFAEGALLLGAEALEAGDGDEARRWLGHASFARPGDVEILLRLGLAELLPGGDLARARTALESAYGIDATSPSLRNALGCLEYREGNYADSRRWFDGVKKDIQQIFEEEESRRDDESLRSSLDYARTAIERVTSAERDEVWVDTFDRGDSADVLNNWRQVERFGIDILQRDGAAVFDGTQAFESGGVTSLRQEIVGDDFVRYRAWLRVSPETESGAVISIRLESADESRGLVFSRGDRNRPSVAVNGGDGWNDVEPSGDRDDSGVEFSKLRWPRDGELHSFEIAVDDDERVTLSIDGEWAIRGLRLPFRSGADALIGVSVQADQGTRVRFELDKVELFRRPELVEGRRVR